MSREYLPFPRLPGVPRPEAYTALTSPLVPQAAWTPRRREPGKEFLATAFIVACALGALLRG